VYAGIYIELIATNVSVNVIMHVCIWGEGVLYIYMMLGWGRCLQMGARTPKALKVYDEFEMYRASCSWLGAHDYIL
jgi:hypothetical protein